MKLVVMLPAFNEGESIANVVAGIPRKLNGIGSAEILIVDDGSVDDTVEQARAAGADKVVSHGTNQGLGIAFRNGIEAALSMGADVIVTMDADGQFDSADIPRLIEPIINNQADFVTASRFHKQYKAKMPWIKGLGNRIFTRIISYLLGQKFSDTQCGFRAYSRQAALRLNTFGRFTYTQEVFIDLVNKGMRVQEVAVHVEQRQKGKSRIVKNWFNYGTRAMAIIIRSFRDYKPLRFFGTIGLITLIPGIAVGLSLLIYWAITGRTSPFTSLLYLVVILVVMGLLFIVLALIADMIGRQRRINEEILYHLKIRRYMDEDVK
jgi:glycosyltransferase involved in cell wall biosynthesis